jgi:hypothetical protein
MGLPSGSTPPPLPITTPVLPGFNPSCFSIRVCHSIAAAAATDRLGGKTVRRPLRAWPAYGCLAEDARQPRAGIRDRPIHDSRQDPVTIATFRDPRLADLGRAIRFRRMDPRVVNWQLDALRGWVEDWRRPSPPRRATGNRAVICDVCAAILKYRRLSPRTSLRGLRVLCNCGSVTN